MALVVGRSTVATALAFGLGIGLGLGLGLGTEHLASASGGHAGEIGDLTFSAAGSSLSGRLFPGGTVDIIVSITNPTPRSVTITRVELPPSTAFASGYATAERRIPVPACGPSATGSDVRWRGGAETQASSHALLRPLVVAAWGSPEDPMRVTFVDAAVMGTTASPACEGIYFKMPPIEGSAVVSTGTTGAPATTARDEWEP